MALLDDTISDDTLALAWARVRSNGGGAGSDKVSLEEFGRNGLSRIARLRDQVRDGRYNPEPLLRMALPRPGREPRLLAVPSVRDRILQTAAAMVLSPVLEPQFEDESFAYRPGRSVRDAVGRVAAIRDAGFQYVVDGDISAFFDNIPHEELIARLAELLPDDSLLALMRTWLATPVQTPGGCVHMHKGVAQGSPLSPLLANLYLDGFDEAIAADDGRRLVRYADDFLILCHDNETAELALEDAALWLANAQLEVNFDKTRIATFAQGISFLGVHFENATQWAEDPAAEIWVLPPRLRPRHAAAVDSVREPYSHIVPAKPMATRRDRPSTAPVDPGREREVRYDEAPAPLLRTLYLAEPGAYLRLDGGRILVLKDGVEQLALPLEKLDQVLAADEGAVSFAVLRALLERGASFVVQGRAWEALGACLRLDDPRVELRHIQHRRCDDDVFRLAAARAMVAGKIANSRLLLRRHYRFRPGGESPAEIPLREMQAHALRAVDMDELLGVEGAAARAYFAGFAGLLPERWRFPGRHRQPPTDPVNALLSYGYGVLFQNLLTLVVERGLDPHVGCLHALRNGHAALVSDLMEEFRALVVDTTVLNLLVRNSVRDGDFQVGEGQACRLGVSLRKEYLRALEAKMQSRVVHPVSGREGDYRRAMRQQVAHWIEVLEGGVPVYRPFVQR